jgi:hypothetical protein
MNVITIQDLYLGTIASILKGAGYHIALQVLVGSEEMSPRGRLWVMPEKTTRADVCVSFEFRAQGVHLQVQFRDDGTKSNVPMMIGYVEGIDSWCEQLIDALRSRKITDKRSAA